MIDVSSLGNLVFTPAANANGTGYASFTFQVQDDGGIANGGVDLDQSPNTLTFDVTPVNDAPAGTDATITLLEDGSHTFAATDFGFTDPNDTPADSFSKVTVTTLPTAGSLKLSGVPVGAGDVIDVSSLGNLVFTPAANANGTGYASFTFQVQDDGGIANGGVDLDQSPNTLTFDVTPVNDAPAGTDATITLLEDGSHTFAATDFGFTDPNDTPADSFSKVTVTTLPTAGSLKLSGVPVGAGDVIDVSSLGDLVFTPAANANGTGYASFTFQVQDDGGIANGGVDLDQSPNTLTFDVTPVNDAPAGTDATITLLEDGSHTFAATDFGFTDPNDTPADSFSKVTVTTLPTAGSLKLSGVPVGAGDVIDVSSLGNLVFTPAANANGTGYASFTFQVQDDGGIANGGVDLDQSPNTLTFDVTPVNDAPVLTTTVSPLAYTDGDGAVAIDPGITVSDIDSANLSGATVSITTGYNATEDTLAFTNTPNITVQNNTGGVLTLTGTDTVANYQLALRSVTYANSGTHPSTVQRVVTFVATDSSAAPSNPATRTINISPPNATPVADSQGPLTFAEDSVGNSITLTATDADDNNLTFTAVDPANGTLSTLTPAANCAAVNTCSATLTYSPDANYNGPDSFTFKVNDGTVDSNTATVTITVTAVNDPPVAVDDSLTSVAEDSGQRTITIASLTANDSAGPANESGQALTITAVSNPVGGTVTLSAPNVLFTPAANFNGTASFDYTLQDNGQTNGVDDFKTDTGSVSFTVTAVNDPPVAVDDSLTSVAEDSGQRTITIASLTANDSAGPANESGQALTITAVSNPVGGTVTLSAPNVLFTPAANFNGTASFDYTLQDNGQTNGVDDFKTDTGSVSFTVTAVNDPPVAVDDSLTSVAEDSGQRTITIASLTANDSAGPANESGQALTITAVSNPVGGTVTLSAPNVLFTPAANFNGTASFDYTLQDNGQTNGVDDFKTDTGSVSFTVTAVNDPPVAAAKSFTATSGLAIGYTINLAANGSGDVTDADNGDAGFTNAFTLNAPTFGSIATDCSPACPVAPIISATDGAAGTFTFDSPPGGYVGSITLHYTVTDNGNPLPAQTSAAAAITISVKGTDGTGTGPSLLFADLTNGSDATGIGSAAHPYQTLAKVVTVDGTNTRVFLFSSATTYSGTFGLNSGEWLVGQATTGAASFDALMGITSGPPAGTLARPSIGTGTVSLNNTLTLNTNGVAKGLAISSGTATGVTDQAAAITGVTVDQVAVSTTTGTGINLSDIAGTLTFTGLTTTNAGGVSLTGSNSSATVGFSNVTISAAANVGFVASGGATVSVTGSGNSIQTGTGQVLSLDSVLVGSLGIAFSSLTATGTVANTAILLNNVDGSGNTLSSGGVSIAATSGVTSDGIRISGGSAATFSFNGTTTISSTGNDGINLSGANGAVSFNSVALNGMAGDGIDISGNTNSVTVSGGSIGNTNDPTGDGVNVNTSGTGNVSVAASITKTTAGNVVNVSGHTGGTVAFSGAISGTGAVADGINLTSNTGATINFSGGMTLTTGANTAFNATGGATAVNVTNGANNSITTTTGTALDVANTTIGASGLTFQSISANGGSNGIVLNNTGANAGLTVTGTSGSTLNDGSGGTIQNETGAEASPVENATLGVGIYLNNTKNPSFNHMNLHDFSNYALAGTTVNGFTMTYTTINGVNGTGPNRQGGIRRRLRHVPGPCRVCDFRPFQLQRRCV